MSGEHLVPTSRLSRRPIIRARGGRLVVLVAAAAAALTMAVSAHATTLDVASANLAGYGGTCTAEAPTPPPDQAPYTIPCSP